MIRIRGHSNQRSPGCCCTGPGIYQIGARERGGKRGPIPPAYIPPAQTPQPPPPPPPPPFKASSITNRINNKSIKAALYSLLLITNIHKKYMSRLHNIPRSAHTNTPYRYDRTGFSLQSLVLRNAQRLTFHVTLRTEVLDLPR